MHRETPESLRAAIVSRLLVHVEFARDNSAVTPNCRLAALENFTEQRLRHACQ
jgi:hypothetical protein